MVQYVDKPNDCKPLFYWTTRDKRTGNFRLPVPSSYFPRLPICYMKLLVQKHTRSEVKTVGSLLDGENQVGMRHNNNSHDPLHCRLTIIEFRERDKREKGEKEREGENS